MSASSFTFQPLTFPSPQYPQTQPSTKHTFRPIESISSKNAHNSTKQIDRQPYRKFKRVESTTHLQTTPQPQKVSSLHLDATMSDMSHALTEQAASVISNISRLDTPMSDASTERAASVIPNDLDSDLDEELSMINERVQKIDLFCNERL